MVLQDLPPSSRPGFRPKLFRFRSTSSYGFSFSAGDDEFDNRMSADSDYGSKGRECLGQEGSTERGHTEAGLTGDEA